MLISNVFRIGLFSSDWDHGWDHGWDRDWDRKHEHKDHHHRWWHDRDGHWYHD